MGGSAHLNYTAGGLIFAGGVAGYAKAGSVPSLIAGVCVGSTLIGAGYMIGKGNDFEGHAVGAAASWAVTAGMGQRFARTGKLMPTGVVATIGLVTALYNSKKAKDWA
jgi:uncharacterized membrane protein (UPF0136 family)